MTDAKSEWTKDHPKAIGWWVCADGERRWVCGWTEHGAVVVYEAGSFAFTKGLYDFMRPIRPYVETKKIEVEAWAVISMDGVLLDVSTSASGAEYQAKNIKGARAIVRLTGTVEI